jgi:DNA processing protein
MTEAEKLAWLRLTHTENVGPVTFHQLVARYGSATAALEALPELAARGGLKRKLTVPSPAECEKELAALKHAKAAVLASCETAYPALLKQIPDAPPVLLVQGHANLLHKPCVAFVGARNASLNGRRLAEKLARDVGQAGWIVVSGLAAGIDGAAHQGALTTGTIGVIAGGFDHIYPPEHAALYDKLRESGVIVTEMPLGTGIKPQLFPRRNRIVSGLCRGTVVIEAALKSGSLITARLATEQGREVMAIPGSPLDPRSGGTNRLIKDGATLIEGAADILACLEDISARESEAPSFTPKPPEKIDESAVDAARLTLLSALSPVPVPVDEVIRLCDLPSPVVSAALLELELAGRVTRLPGNQVALVATDALAGAV